MDKGLVNECNSVLVKAYCKYCEPQEMLSICFLPIPKSPLFIFILTVQRKL